MSATKRTSINNGKKSVTTYEFTEPSYMVRPQQSFGKFIYDKDNHSFFGRNLKSWGKLNVF